jgi:hypothetical protein
MFMSVASGLLILTGLEIMAFGLFMLYAWLALLYAPIGFDAGILLGRHSPGMLVQQRLLSALLARLFLAPGHLHSSPAGACCLVFPAVSCLAFPWPPLSDSMAGLMASLAECSHWSAARLEACLRRGSSIRLSSVHPPLIGAALVMTGANHITGGRGVQPCRRRHITVTGHDHSGRSRPELATHQHHKVGSSGARGSRRLRYFGRATIRAATSEIRLLTMGLDQK